MSVPVSIVIPTRNGAPTIAAVFDAIASQDHDGAVEVVAVDSGSTDGTLDILGQRADTLIEIAPVEFNHGSTRNLGIKAATSDLVVLLVQDAIPADTTWLSALVRPFADNGTLAGTFARQLPHPDASRLTRWSLERWIAARSEPRTSTLGDHQEFESMTPTERFETCAFDNVCSCVRRSVWEAHHFPATTIAEDVEWGRTVLLAGHSIAFVPDATVRHSHERSLAYEFDRTCRIHQRLGHLFGLRTIPSLPLLIRSILATLAEHNRGLASTAGPQPGLRGRMRAAGLAVVWPLGQYLGGRRG